MLAKMESSADDKQTFTQAMQSPDSAKWVETCAAEVVSLLDNEVHGVPRSSLREVPFRSSQCVHGEGQALRRDECKANGSRLMTKHASVRVVCYNKKLIGVM